jgi:putative DNA primase/helicase
MVGLHRTYLKDGKKAAVDMPKKTLGKLDASCAIRLFPAKEVLGVAEGIETAIAASRIYKIPFWALISAGQMERFEYPKSIRRLIVCGDNDKKFTGQKSAFSLAHRAAMKGLEVECLMPEQVGTDFADVKW